MRAGVVALAVFLLAGCAGGDPELGSSIDYDRNSGGIVGQQLTAHIDLGSGRVTAEGGSGRVNCASGGSSAQLRPAQLAHLKDALATADLPHAESLDEPQVEAPETGIRSGEVSFRRVGFKPLPERVRPLVAELERAARYACRAGGP
jgi:hypothetical protein